MKTSTLVEATYPSKVASTGVLQGDAANANVSPAKYAWTPYNINEKLMAFSSSQVRQSKPAGPWMCEELTMG